jgi:hypothetical protein
MLSFEVYYIYTFEVSITKYITALKVEGGERGAKGI